MDRKTRITKIAEEALRNGRGEFHIRVEPKDNKTSECVFLGSGSDGGLLRAANAFLNSTVAIMAQDGDGDGQNYEEVREIVLEILAEMNRLTDHGTIVQRIDRKDND